jgi:tRNA 2-(methylsulfanyl)-N6-isopentenyladenosine37 hydroxylase
MTVSQYAVVVQPTFRYCEREKMTPAEIVAAMPLRSRTPLAWGKAALADPVALLADHAFLEMKAANNAMDLMTRWPGDWVPGWVETMTSVARDEAAHLAQVSRLLLRRGGRLTRGHSNPYARDLRLLVRRGGDPEVLDRLFVSALIELRSCERFAVLMEAAEDAELRSMYKALFSSEHGHYRVFLKLAFKAGERELVESRWAHMLEREAVILAGQKPGCRIHSGASAESFGEHRGKSR